LTGSYDTTAKLWDASTGAEERTFTGHLSPVYSVAFSPDGKYVLTGGEDNTARLWDASTAAEIRTYIGHTGAVNSVAFSPDGKYILTGSNDRTARLWDTDYLDSIRWACEHLTRDLVSEERVKYGIINNSPTCP
jgi:WD40 repeat protein